MKFSFQSLKVFVGRFRLFLGLYAASWDDPAIKNNEASLFEYFVVLGFNPPHISLSPAE